MGEKETREYREKLLTSKKAVGLVSSGDRIIYSDFVLFPETLDAALADRAEELENVDIRSVYYTKVPEVARKDPEKKHFILSDCYFGKVSRELQKQDLCYYVPSTYHQGPRVLKKYCDADLAFITVGPMDERGYFNYGLANSGIAAAVGKAKKVIVEVNSNVPYCLGGNMESVHISRVDHIVESENPPLLEVPHIIPNEIEKKIAENIMGEIQDGSCLQMGFSGLHAALADKISNSDLRDLGVHTDVFVDYCVDLYESKKVTGAAKNIDRYKMSYTFAFGSKRMYDFLDQNPTCTSYPVNYISDPRIIAMNDRVLAVYNAFEVDLFGQVSSESIGPEQKSGSGGELDFMFGAFASHGGKGIVSVQSTYTDSDGNEKSRIVPSLLSGSIVTVPRSIVHHVATEYGVVQLKGKSTWERAEALISIAHPKFRDELIQKADEMKIWLNRNR